MITMEKIDYVMNVTGASYEVVRVALLDADGDVDKAINIIAHSVVIKEREEKKDFINFNDIKNAIKEIWDKGNASKLIVEKNGETILSLSLTVSAVGLILAPLASALGAGVVLIHDYDFKILMDSGEIIDIKEYINLNRLKKEYHHNKDEENSEEDNDSNEEK